MKKRNETRRNAKTPKTPKTLDPRRIAAVRGGNWAAVIDEWINMGCPND